MYCYNIKRISLSGILLLFVASAGCNTRQTTQDKTNFSFVGGTIKQLKNALKTGNITCQEVVKGYLKRIKFYDGDGTKADLKSIINTNPNALKEARQKDEFLKENGIPDSLSLFCVPVIAKDNINTIDMPTTGGALAFKNNQPTYDAFIINKMRRKGAIIIAKGNLDEFAFSTLGESSIRGLVKNAYDLTKGAGGSSSGPATAIASNFAIIGIGTDTGSSIRTPSSLAGLVGIRPSLRLVSQTGIMPLATWQDTAGPMCRTVQDCAVALDAMVGFDSNYQSNQRFRFNIYSRLINNKEEFKEVTNIPNSYTKFLDLDGLKGARIGVVRALFGKDSAAVNIVNPVINKAIENMRTAGAIVEDVKIGDLHTMLYDYHNVGHFQFKQSLVKYLNSWPNTQDNHLLSYKKLVESGGYLSHNKHSLERDGKINLWLLTKKKWKDYKKNTIDRPKFIRKRLLHALNNTDASGQKLGKSFDILLYPEIIGIAPKLGGKPKSGKNAHLSPFSGFPALVMPAGMATNLKPTMPIGMEFLGREFDEPTLIKIAYSYQELFHPRKPSTLTPQLNSSNKAGAMQK